MSKHIVIAGAVPSLHAKKLFPKKWDILEEKDLAAGEATDLIKLGFIEEYKPHKITKEDAEMYPALDEHLGLGEGDEIHEGHLATLKPKVVAKPKPGIKKEEPKKEEPAK